MSSDTRTGEAEPDVDAPICRYCGLAIEEIDKRCPALDDGRCVA
ncbi:MAG: hypothetical protein ABEI11_03805 [Haloarculaceae archaeon]